MPITQDRMLKLLETCEAYIDAYAELKKATALSINSMNNGKEDPRETAYALRDFIDAFEPPPDHRIFTAIERQHFKDTAKKNDYARKQMKLRRMREREGYATAIHRSTRSTNTEEPLPKPYIAPPSAEPEPMEDMTPKSGILNFADGVRQLEGEHKPDPAPKAKSYNPKAGILPQDLDKTSVDGEEFSPLTPEDIMNALKGFG